MKNIADLTHLSIHLKLSKNPSLKKIESFIPKNLSMLNKEIKIEKNELIISFEIPKTALLVSKGSQANIQKYILLKESVHGEEIGELVHNLYLNYGVLEDSSLEGSFKLKKVLGASFFQEEGFSGKTKSSFASDSVSVNFLIKKPNIEKTTKEWDLFQSRLNRFTGLE